jgi:gliding motility-associated lipoprotein GldJ
MRYSEKFFFLALLCSVSIVGCTNDHRRSPTTSWYYDNPKGLNFKSVDLLPAPPPGMVFIPGGSFVMGSTQESLVLDPDNLPKYASVSGFYMDQTEVTNVAYCEYIAWMARVFSQSNPSTYTAALPDTTVWRNSLSFNDPHTTDYLRHPSFKNYPVVGVSWNQANQFCEWRTDRVNEQRLIDAGFLNYTSQQGEQHFNTRSYLAGFYRPELPKHKRKKNLDGEVIYPTLEDGYFILSYRLPSEAEWEYAAQSLIGRTTASMVMERRIYPWNERGLRSGPGARQGDFQANLKQNVNSPNGIASYEVLRGGPTAPVRYYKPNDFGLYGMAGNVNEWVADLYRSNTFMDADNSSPYMGGGYSQTTITSDGELARDSAGRILYIRDNQRYTNDLLTSYLDSMVVAQNPNGMTQNENRIYKGGSFRDHAYWITPGARRFLRQNKAKDDIGFRCAMIGPGPARNSR